MTIFTKEINKRKFEGNAARAEFDLLDQLLNLKDDDGHQLQDEGVLDNIVGLIIAGYEFTSLQLCGFCIISPSTPIYSKSYRYK